MMTMTQQPTTAPRGLPVGNRARQANRAYQTASSHRNARLQEADVFLRANAALRAARDAEPAIRVRAICDNRRLWRTVMDAVQDPNNRLPPPLRAGLLSVGMTVQRVLRQREPDFDWLIRLNEQIAAGLSGT